MLADYIEEKPVIETKRLRLRKMTIEDVDSLSEWMSSKDMYKYWGKGAGRTDKDPSLLFVRGEKPTKSFHLGIELKPNPCRDDNIGSCNAQSSSCTGPIIGEFWVYLIENDRMAKLACRIAEKYWGKGYATEALNAMVKFCFENTELQRLWTDVDVRNIGSCRVLEKGGFTREGLIRQGKMVSTWCDYYIYGLLRSDLE